MGTQVDPGRAAAVRAILRTDAGCPLQEALARELDGPELARGARNLCSDLAYGFFRTRIRIEHILGRFLANPRKLPKTMGIWLALAVYSLLFQAGTPDYAVIDQTVERIKKLFGQRLARVANGVLREIQRQKANLENPAWYGASKWEGKALFWAIPEGMAELWLKAYGEENAEALLKRSFARPWTGIRINPRHGSADEIGQALRDIAGAAGIGKWGIALPPGSVPDALLGHELDYWRSQGAIRLQAAGSMAVLEQLGVYGWEEPVWDCCAGVGGKSLALLDAAVKVGLLSDTSWKRLERAKRSCGGLAIVADAAAPPMRRWSGNILADVPCSGLGVLGRRPDIKIRFKPEDAGRQCARQRAILEGLWPVLRPGAVLAYITCALNPAENEEMMAWALQKFSGCRLVRQWQTPHDHPWLEGMFGALLKKLA